MSSAYSSGFPLRPGDEINGYRIEKAFDPGGFAFAARALARDGRRVFFKKYKKPGGSSAWFEGFVRYQTKLKTRIQTDAAAKQLCYEFIEFFEMNRPSTTVKMRAFYQVFEWVEGGTDLRGVLQSGVSTYGWNQRVIFARVMMAGINALHNAGVVHTDLKPENFYLLPEPMIAAKFKLRVIDLDFALLDSQQAPWHGHEGYVTTPGYASPEHLSGQVPSKASDVFTCGVILGELLGRGHPGAADIDTYDERAKRGTLDRIALRQPIAEAGDPEFLSYVIDGMLRPDASARPSAGDVLKALNGRLESWDGRRSGLPPVVAPARPVSTPPRPPAAAVPAPIPVVPVPAASVAEGVTIEGPNGTHLAVRVPTILGFPVFSSWSPDFQRFMAREQFRLEKNGSGQWTIAHCPSATNPTTIDGTPISAPMVIKSGMRLALGRTGKCPVVLKLGGR